MKPVPLAVTQTWAPRRPTNLIHLSIIYLVNHLFHKLTVIKILLISKPFATTNSAMVIIPKLRPVASAGKFARTNTELVGGQHLPSDWLNDQFFSSPLTQGKNRLSAKLLHLSLGDKRGCRPQRAPKQLKGKRAQVSKLELF